MAKRFKVKELTSRGLLPVYGVIDCRQVFEGIFCTSSKKENACAVADALNKFYKPVINELELFNNYFIND